MIKKILIVSVCLIALLTLTVVNHKYNGIGIKPDYLENEKFWNDIRDISFSKYKELNVSYMCINRSSRISLKGERYRLWIQKKDSTTYFENLTDIFTEEEAEKIECVFKRKVNSIQIGNTLVGDNTIVFYGCNFLDSYNALIYLYGDNEIYSNEKKKVIQIKEQWYLLHSL